jgi:hypothetical protein
MRCLYSTACLMLQCDMTEMRLEHSSLTPPHYYYEPSTVSSSETSLFFFQQGLSSSTPRVSISPSRNLSLLQIGK